MPADRLAPSQLLVRALALLGPVVALLASGPAGHWPPWWVVTGVAALAAAAALAPDSQLPAGAALAVLVWWTITLGADLTTWVMAAAVALVVGHVAALLAAYGPATMPVDRPTARLWARRGAVVLLTVPAAWLLTHLLDGLDQPGIWLLGVGTTLAATLLATAALSSRGA